jgi:hypothetical protein
MWNSSLLPPKLSTKRLSLWQQLSSCHFLSLYFLHAEVWDIGKAKKASSNYSWLTQYSRTDLESKKVCICLNLFQSSN